MCELSRLVICVPVFNTLFPLSSQDMEKKVLNALIRRYFLDVPYSMSAVTFEQECGGIDDSFADLPLENASMPSAEEKFSLLGLYRQQIEPVRAKSFLIF